MTVKSWPAVPPKLMVTITTRTPPFLLFDAPDMPVPEDDVQTFIYLAREVEWVNGGATLRTLLVVPPGKDQEALIHLQHVAKVSIEAVPG